MARERESGQRGSKEREERRADGSKTGSETPSDTEGGIDRRTYLRGMAVASLPAGGYLAGALTKESDGVEREIEPVSAYGYGGTPIVERQDSLTVSTEPADTQTLATSEVEPNDSRANATVIGFDADVTGKLAKREADWFAFEVSEEIELTVSFTRSTGEGITGIALYGPEGFRDQMYVATAQTAEIRETISTAETYFLEIIDVNGGTGSYTVRLETGADQMPAETPTQTPTTTTKTPPTATATPTRTPTPAPTATLTPSQTPTPSEEYGVQGYGEHGYGGIG